MTTPPNRFVIIDIDGVEWIWDTEQDEFIRQQSSHDGGDCWESEEDPDVERPNPWET